MARDINVDRDPLTKLQIACLTCGCPWELGWYWGLETSSFPSSWATRKIEYYKGKIDAIDDGWVTKDSRKKCLYHLLMRVIAVAMPIFALIDSIYLGFFHKWDNAIIPKFRTKDTVIAFSIFRSILCAAITPFALFSPTQFYRTGEHWDENGLPNLRKFNAKSIKESEQKLDLLAKSLGTCDAEKSVTEIYNLLTKEVSFGAIRSWQESRRPLHSYPDHMSQLLKKARTVLTHLKEKLDDTIDHKKLFEKTELALELTTWVSTEPSCHRKQAAKEIQCAFEKNATSLNLSALYLSELPPCIGRLSHLKYILLYRTKLKSLPQELAQLPQLEWLLLKRNKFQIMPPVIGQLPLLKRLDLSKNQLDTLPNDIGQLHLLEKLSLRKLKLKSLPSELGQLHNLKKLNISGNPDLKELPMSLGQIPALVQIRSANTGVRKEVCKAILKLCIKTRLNEKYDIFLSRLHTWQVQGQCQGLDEEQLKRILAKAESLNNWLIRLEKTKDFKSSFQTVMAKTVCEVLLHAAKDYAFQDLLAAQIESNLECCEDRAAMCLNEIYTMFKLAQLNESESLDKRLKIMCSGAKTLALRAAIAKRIDKHQKEIKSIESESAEIYLYYEIKLKETLDLLSMINSMTYDIVGKRDWISESSLIEETKNTYLNYLIEFPQFESMIASDVEYKSAYKKHIKLLDVTLGEQLDKEPKNVSERSSKFLEWRHEIGKLTAERKLALDDIKKQWVEKKLYIKVF